MKTKPATIPEVLQSPAKVEAPPPATGYKAILKHLSSWFEVYGIFPISLVGIILAAKFVLFLTGRAPVEGADHVVGTAFRLVTCVLVICLVTVTRQQSSFWLSKADALAHPLTHAIQSATKVAFAILFAWILLN